MLIFSDVWCKPVEIGIVQVVSKLPYYVLRSIFYLNTMYNLLL